MLIYKEQLPIATADIRKVTMHYQTVKEAKEHIFKLDVQYGQPCFWYQVDGGNNGNYEFAIVAIGTGHEEDSSLFSKENYLGSLLLSGGDLVLSIISCFSQTRNKTEHTF